MREIKDADADLLALRTTRNMECRLCKTKSEVPVGC